MPFVHPLSVDSRSVIAALGMALAAPGRAHADSSTDSATPSLGETALFARATIAGSEALDDHALERQPGTGPGLMQLLKGTPSVTLWDELAPPAPLPIPADSSHAAQSNAVSYFRP
jgi:hypothetical protein